ncbi:MAG: activator of (R)-2-hydroxyglutaryl-CoA dehydratase [Ectothiorhodospiraceae bacterium]|nr:activator of (R)-2-hydroxyglutaryl-CoA dehydratase [Ectothiorhodospiraceae bacterium]
MEHTFTREQRENTTVLFGGLTWKHERLIQARLQGLGYTAEYLPTPDTKAFQTGKEFGNNGQCNPTYFTVGNLINYLQHLEEQGESRKEIIQKYVFFTAGACGPCRFGMYEAEYRSALRNADFDGFRVLLFQQTGGLNQVDGEAGLEMNLDFFLGIINALNIGDLLGDVANQIRPYEIEEGATDAALEQGIEIVADTFRKYQAFGVNEDDWYARIAPLRDPAEQLGKYIQQLFGSDLYDAMVAVKEVFQQVRVDRTRVKPTVKITGEFWAQITEGDGNYNMFRFLEREGAQIIVEPIANWLLYMLHQYKQELRDRKFLDVEENGNVLRNALAKLASWKDYRKSVALLALAENVFVREYNKLRKALGYLPAPLSDQYSMQRIAHPYYNSRIEGGEGHLEVAKNIYYSTRNLCHMVLSLKPFGCMPSTQSDGVQSAVTSHHKEINYIPIETSGEGEINAHSRVQMALGEAKIKARSEYTEVLVNRGITEDEVKLFIAHKPELQSPFYSVPKQEHISGTAANFAWHIADLMKKPRKDVRSL